MGSMPEPRDEHPVPLAVVGIGCRFPGEANDVDSFWSLLTQDQGAWSPLPKERYNAETGFYHPNRQRKGYFNIKGGYYLSDMSHFDARFFGITAGEALAMDPQQRILLECTYEALQDAGIPKEAVAGSRTGVFVTGNRCDYQTNQSLDWCSGPTLTAIATHTSMLANGISYHFDLRGPSVTSDTACSSSVYALHQALYSLRTGESDMAIVAGCALNLSPGKLIYMSYTGLLNPEGRTYAFDERAKGGYACGEGAGVLVLKPLHKAVRDNDRIYSVVLDTAINHGGKSASVTAPNSFAQEQLIRELYAKSGLSTEDVGFVEAHAAGTRVGDPVEVTAIYKAFRPDQTPDQPPLQIGSVKSHIGHLESVSGIASIIKGSLMLAKRTLVPNADLKQLNSKIPFEKWNMDVPRQTSPWPQNKRLVSVNNFGFGGANGHCILAPAPASLPPDTPPSDEADDAQKRLFVLSANDEATAVRLAENYANFLESNIDLDPADLAYTLGERRTQLSYRLAAVASDCKHLAAKLREDTKGLSRAMKGGASPKIAFVFTGQGSQWFGMGRELFGNYSKFASVLRTADEYLQELGSGFSLLDELFNKEQDSRIDEPAITQPACAAIGIALVELFADWGIKPYAVVGHSSGEIAAAYAAGLVNLRGALAIAYHRGQAMLELQKAHPHINGTMMAVGADKSVVQSLVTPIRRRRNSGVLTIACENSPESTTLSGKVSAIDELADVLEAQGIYHKKLGHTVAYHSPHMELVAEHYAEALDRVGPLSDPTAPRKADFFSSRYGYHAERTDATYWVETMTKPVKFSQALQDLCAAAATLGPDVVVEIGPHSILQMPIKQCLKAAGLGERTVYYPSMVRKQDSNYTCLDLVAQLFKMGQPLDFGQINRTANAASKPKLVSGLPTYPWPRTEQNRYWADAHLVGRGLYSSTGPDILGQKVQWTNDLDMTWRQVITLDDMPFVRQYRLNDVATFPLSGYICVALEAATHQATVRGRTFTSFALRDFQVLEPLMWHEGEELELITTLRGSPSAEENEFTFMSWSGSRGWSFHCRGLIGVCQTTFSPKLSLTQPGLQQNGVNVGITRPRHDSVTDLTQSVTLPVAETKLDPPSAPQLGDSMNSASRTFTIPELAPNRAEFRQPTALHPHVLDALLQSTTSLHPNATGLWTPTGVESLNLNRLLPTRPGDKIHVVALQNFETGSALGAGLAVLASCNADFSEACLEVQGLKGDYHQTKRSMPNEEVPSVTFKVHWEPAESGSDTREERSDADRAEMTNGHSHGSSYFSNVVIVQDGSPQAQKLSDMLHVQLTSGAQDTILQSTITEVDPLDKFCLLVCDVESSASLLSDVTEVTFGKIKQILMDSEGVLCVTSGAYKNSMNPNANMLSGLTRTVRAETLAKIAMLDLQPIPNETFESTFTEPQVQAILDVLRRVRQSGLGTDMEFAEEQGTILVPRILTDQDLDRVIDGEKQGHTIPFLQPWKPEKRLRLAGPLPGAETGDLYFEKDHQPSLNDDEVEIAVAATRVRNEDAKAALHGTPAFSLAECSGVVARKGSGVHTLSIGDRVCALACSGFSTFVRCRWDRAIRIPESLSPEKAASVLLPYATAYRAIMELGQLHQGQSALIVASGALRDAAIQVARVAGARIFVAVNGDEDGKQLLEHVHGIKQEYLIDCRHNNLDATVGRLTHSVGVDLVAMYQPEAKALRESMRCVAPFGRVVMMSEYRLGSTSDAVRPPQNASLSSFDLETMMTSKTDAAATAAAGVARLLQAGLITPMQPTIHGIAGLTSTFQDIVAGSPNETHVIAPQVGEEITALYSNARGSLLDPDGCYIIVGGTGGIGRSIATWMVSRGAQKVVLLSRSGKTNERVTTLIQEARAEGAEIIVKTCDVSDKLQVRETIEWCKVLGPIRGVVQSAMVLRDVLFENMTLLDYQTVVQPKVTGTWNLHEALTGADLDFFIMLSSTAGVIGNRGQAAYAAANTFLDAFANYRGRQGLPAVSIDLGAVENIGYIADQHGERSEEILRNIHAGGNGLHEADILALVSAAVKGAMNVTCNRQCITGFATFTSAAISALSQDAKFTYLVKNAADTGKISPISPTGNQLSSFIAGTASKDKARVMATDLFVAKLAEILSMSKGEVSKNSDILTALDSLTAIEFQNWIATRCQVRLKLMDLLDVSSLDDLISKVLVKVRPEWSA